MLFTGEKNRTQNSLQKEQNFMCLGENIAALRKNRGFTQEELAKRLGVSPQAVSKWENGTACPDIALLPEIADIFSVTVDDLMRVPAERLISNENKQGKDESEADKSATDFKDCKPCGFEAKKVNISIIQQNGKPVNVKLPFNLVKTGMKIGSIYGLPQNLFNSVAEAISSEEIGEILSLDGENGEKITITIE